MIDWNILLPDVKRDTVVVVGFCAGVITFLVFVLVFVGFVSIPWGAHLWDVITGFWFG